MSEQKDDEPVGIVQRVSINGYPMADSSGVEWLSPVLCGSRLYTRPAESQSADPVAEVHPNHLRPDPNNNGGHFCREVLLYSGNSPHDWKDGKNSRVKLYLHPTSAEPGERVLFVRVRGEWFQANPEYVEQAKVAGYEAFWFEKKEQAMSEQKVPLPAPVGNGHDDWIREFYADPQPDKDEHSEFERECADADKLLLSLGLDPDACRTDGGSLNPAKIKHLLVERMVSRFLGWPLPETFAPDCGISFDGRKDDEWNKNKTWPVGTNLFTAEQARQMFEHMMGDPLEQNAALKADSPDKDEIMRLADEYAYGFTLVPNAARAALDAAVERVCRERDEALRGLRVQSVEYAEAVDDLRQAEERAERAERAEQERDNAVSGVLQASIDASKIIDEAQQRCERAEREAAEYKRDAERYRWLTEDWIGDPRERQIALLDRMAVMGKGAIDAAIDAAMKEGK